MNEVSWAPCCYTCQKPTAWYRFVPIQSFFNTDCRHCSAPLTPRIPWFELYSTFMLYALIHVSVSSFLLAYFVLFSALLISMHTDWHTFMISRFTSLFLVPVGIACASMHLLPISTFESSISALGAYAALWIITTLFYAVTGKVGMGEGDWELLACIGSFVGVLGTWFTITLGSLCGIVFGALYVLSAKRHNPIIPFGPFLAATAMLFVLLDQWLFLSDWLLFAL
jgi:leader peptidase (prepilin peptidase) / N-methyltransferase